MERHGWVTYPASTNKRIKPIEITKKGVKISKACRYLLDELKYEQ
jgi:hypothetical protein